MYRNVLTHVPASDMLGLSTVFKIRENKGERGITMKKVMAWILTLAIGIGGMTGCGAARDTAGQGNSEGTKSAGPVKIKVGVLSAMTALPVVDIVNNGLDKENGIELELISFSTGAPMNEAMAAGEIDASCIGAAAVFSLANNNSKMICEICTDTIAIDLIARGDSRIAEIKGENKDYPEVYGTAEAIKGTTILCPAGTLSQYEVSKYLDVFGLTTDDVNFVPMEYAQAYQAFKTGEGDILATRSPQTYTAVDEEGWISIASLQTLGADATAQLVVSESAFNQKADALAVLVTLMAQEGDKLNSDVEYAASLMSEWFKKNGQDINLEVSKRQLEAKPFYGTEDMKKREFGADFKNTLVEFYIASDQLEEGQRDTVNGNVRNDILVKAGFN